MTAPRRSSRPRYIKWLLFACALFLFGLLSLAALYFYLRTAHRAIRAAARQAPAVTSISSDQGQRLLQELANHPAFSLTIKTDPSDRAANQLAQQLYDILRNSQWHVDLSTASSGPSPGTGLSLAQTGESARPPYPNPSQDPYFFLPSAFNAAQIYIGSEGGQASGEYRLYLLVGHREREQVSLPQGRVLQAGARWFLRHLAALRRHLG